MAAKRRAIPASNVNVDLKLNALQEAVEVGQGVSGQPLERYLTIGDLVDAGIIKLLSNYRGGQIGSGNIGPITNVPELLTPPVPTGLSATGLFTAILLQWDEPQTLYSNHAYTKIYRATADNVANAVAIGSAIGPLYADPVDPLITYYYWISFVSTENVEGPKTIASVSAQASLTAEDLLAGITDTITEGMLYPALRARLDLIDFPDTGLVDKIAQEIIDRAAAVTAEAAARAAALLDEVTARNAAIAVEAANRAQALLDEAAARGAAITAEATTRQTADESLAATTTTLTASVASSVGTLTAAISAEASTRAANDATEATARDTLAVQLRGSSTSGNVNDITSGLIYQERTARATQDSALAEQISLLSAGVGGGFDPYTTWYFEANAESWAVTGATISWAQGAITVTSTGTDPILSRGSLAIVGAEYDAVKMRVKRTGGTGWQGDVKFSTSGHGYSDSYKKTLTDPGATIDDWAILEWNMSSLSAGGTNWKDSSITGLQIELGASASDVFVIDWIAVGRNAPGASVASLTAEQQARATADSAQVTARETLSTKVLGTTDPASVANIAGLSSGLLHEERQARSTADSTEVTARQALSAKLTGVNDPTSQTLATLSAGLLYDERTARASADSAMASQITTLQADVGTNAAAITTEQTARATADTALTTSINSLSSAINNGTNGLSATYTLANSTKTRLDSAGTTGQTIEAIANNAEALRTQVNDSVNGLTATRTRVATVETRISPSGAAGKSYEALVSEFTAAKAVIENPATGNAALAQAVDDLEAVVAGVEGGIDAYVSQTSAIGVRLTRGQPNLFANPDCERSITSHLVGGVLSTASKHSGRSSIAFTGSTQGAAVWKQDETDGWPRFAAGQQFTLGYWARNASPYTVQFGYGTPSAPFGHITLPASTDYTFYQSTFVVPAGAMLADVSTTAAVRINAQTFSGTDSGEFYVHALNAGVASDANGTILDVDGSTLTLQRAAGLTGLAGKTGYICYDKATSARFLAAGVYRRFAFVFINAAGAWAYDNNSAEVTFTPDANMVLIGDLVTGAVDTITAALIWPQALAFVGTALLQPVLAPAFRLLTSGATLTAGVYFDDLVLMAGSHTLDGATAYTVDGTPYALAERIQTTESQISEIDGVIAGHVTAIDQLQISDGTNTAIIQQLQEVVLDPGGLSAQYTLKFDTNGYVSGWGFYSGGVVSTFIVSATRFAVGAPPYVPRTTSTVYAIGAICINSGNTYEVIAVTGDARSGTGPGPSGTGTGNITDGNVTWRFVRTGTTNPTPFQLVVDTTGNAVRMSGASIVDATITNAKILSVAAEKISGLNASFLLATIGEGAITNAYIGNVIQSTIYNPTAGQGWRLDKSGSFIAAGLLLYDNTGKVILNSGNTLTPWQAQSSTMRIKKNFSAYSTADNGECYVHGLNADGSAADIDGYMLYAGGIITVARGPVLTQWVNQTGWIAYYKGTGTSPFLQSGGTTRRKHALVIYSDLFGWLYDNNSSSPQPLSSLTDIVIIGVMRTHATAADGVIPEAYLLPYAQDPVRETLPKISAFSMLDQITPANASTYIANLAVDTLQIANQAVTIPVSASDPNERDIASSFAATYTQCISVGIASTGAPISIHVSTKVMNPRNDETWFRYKLRRAPLFGSFVTIDENRSGDANSYPIRNNAVYPHAFSFRDQPGEGIWVYAVEYCAIEAFIRVQDISIMCLETKK